MVRLDAAEYLDLLLRAHAAEDALEPMGTGEAREPRAPQAAQGPQAIAPILDLAPVFGLLRAAEAVAGLSAREDAALHAAAAA